MRQKFNTVHIPRKISKEEFKALTKYTRLPFRLSFMFSLILVLIGLFYNQSILPIIILLFLIFGILFSYNQNWIYNINDSVTQYTASIKLPQKPNLNFNEIYPLSDLFDRDTLKTKAKLPPFYIKSLTAIKLSNGHEVLIEKGWLYALIKRGIDTETKYKFIVHVNTQTVIKIEGMLDMIDDAKTFSRKSSPIFDFQLFCATCLFMMIGLIEIIFTTDEGDAMSKDPIMMAGSIVTFSGIVYVCLKIFEKRKPVQIRLIAGGSVLFSYCILFICIWLELMPHINQSLLINMLTFNLFLVISLFIHTKIDLSNGLNNRRRLAYLLGESNVVKLNVNKKKTKIVS